MMRVLIMAGGTGGHVFPALAVARTLKEQGHQVIWLGTEHGLEADKVPAAGFHLLYLRIAGFRGKTRGHKLKVIWQMLRAVWQALRIISEQRPDVVLGMGGFASGPGGVAAWLSGVPLVIHEQNAVAGLTNRLLARLAKRILTAFPNVLPHAVVVGNPVDERIEALPDPTERFSKREGNITNTRLLILGGSLGAHALNTTLPEALALLTMRPLVRHQTGKKNAEATQATYNRLDVKASVEPFIDDMASAYGCTDLVVCRAGALTVSELAAAGVSSILVPYPHAVDDHQTKNAALLVQAGAAILMPQTELTPQKLAETIQLLIQDRQRLFEMAKAARALRTTDAAEKVVKICFEVVRRVA